MANPTIIISEKNVQNIFYKNAMISKVHGDDVYDIKFTTGSIRTYVENTSDVKFNSGDYVAVLISDKEGSNICKILGKGKKIQTADLIPIIRVW